MIKSIYKTLLWHYGPQLWWPVTPKGALSPKYTAGPTTDKQRLEVIVGAILTQNTAWKNVEKAMYELNREKLISVPKLREIPAPRLATLIRSSGYFNQKAKKLKCVAEFLHDHPISKLKKMKVKELRPLLLSVNGIGPETADSIILYAFQKPVFVIDAYTKRICVRLGMASASSDYDTWQSLFEDSLRRNHRVFNQYHALLVEHGKNVCKKKPLCGNCVLSNCCKSAFEIAI